MRQNVLADQPAQVEWLHSYGCSHSTFGHYSPEEQIERHQNNKREMFPITARLLSLFVSIGLSLVHHTTSGGQACAC